MKILLAMTVAFSLLGNGADAFCSSIRDHSAKCILSIVGITVVVVLLISAILLMLLWLYDSLTLKTMKLTDEGTTAQSSYANVEGGQSDSEGYSASSSSSSIDLRYRARRGLLVVNE